MERILKIQLVIFNIMAHPNQTLCGLDHQLLCDNPPSYKEKEAFQDWLTRHGYSSAEEYWAEGYADNAGEW